MPDTTQEELLRLFEEAAGKQQSADGLGAEAYSLTGAASGGEKSTDTAPKGNPNPVTPYSAPTGNTGITAESVATTVLESGLGLVPMIAGILGLFEGGQPAPDVFTKYAMPDSIQFEGDMSSGASGTDDFNQMGMPRAVTATPDGAATQTNAWQGTTTATNGATSWSREADYFDPMGGRQADAATLDAAAGQTYAPQRIPIQTNGAMGESSETNYLDQMGMPQADTPGAPATQTSAPQGTPAPTNGVASPSTSPPGAPLQTTAQPGDPQWFMDHSREIAQAVRSAMLNLSSLNDVVSDL